MANDALIVQENLNGDQLKRMIFNQKYAQLVFRHDVSGKGWSCMDVARRGPEGVGRVDGAQCAVDESCRGRQLRWREY